MAFDDGQGGGQSQTSAFAEFSCCEEWSENLIANFGRNPVTRVRHLKQHVWPRFGVGTRIGKPGVDNEIARSQLQFAAFWHGVARVDGKIEQHLMQLCLVAHNGVNVHGNIRFDLYGFAECSGNDANDVFEELLGIDWVALAFQLAAKPKDLFDNVPNAFGIRFQ